MYHSLGPVSKMWTKSENFTLRFFICAVLLVAYAQCQKNKEWKLYAVDGTLVSLTQSNTYGLFDITGMPNERVIQYGNNSRNSDELQEMIVEATLNGRTDPGKQGDSSGGQDLCSVLMHVRVSDDYVLRDIATHLLMYGAENCPLPEGRKFLLNSGFKRVIRLPPNFRLSCTKPWDYHVAVTRNGRTVIWSKFRISPLPLFTCAT